MEESFITEQVRLIATLRMLALQHSFTALHADEEESITDKVSMRDYVEGIILAGKSIGLDLTVEMIFEADENWTDAPNLVSLLKYNVLSRGPLYSIIREQFGAGMTFQLGVAQIVSAIRVLASFYRHIDLRSIAKEIRGELRQELGEAGAFLRASAVFFLNRGEQLDDTFGTAFRDQLWIAASSIVEGRRTRKWFDTAFEQTYDLVNALVPHYPKIKEALDRANELIRELEEIRPGRQDWQAYESLCAKCLRFLFIPPFRSLIEQGRSADGHERRDLILPNNQFGGFWSLIRHEFNSRHIICEVKNVATLRKDDLNQLRIYLAKPTIGRFGLLFCRRGAEKSALIAQRAAYEQDKILILIISDLLLSQMLRAHAFGGSSDYILEHEKATFEVTY